EGMLLVSWAEPALGDGNLPITGYRVEWKLTSASDADYSSANVQQRGTETSATISGLDMDSMSYDVRVRARNRVVDVVGASAWSGSGSGTSLMPEAPSAPGAPTLSSNTSGTLNVSWRAPADGGSAIMRYEVQYKLASAPASAWGSANVAISGLSATITALEEGQDYQVRVRAMNRRGDGPWSRPATGAPSSAQRNARTASSSLSQTGSVLSSGVVDVLGEHLVTPPPATPAAPPPTIAPTPPPLTDADTGTGSGAPAPSPAAPAPDSDERSNFALDRLALGGGSLLPMARTPAPPNPKLYRVRTHADETESVRTLGMRDILNQGAFRLSLNGRDGDKSADGARSSWAVWGRGNARGFSSNPSGLSSLEGNAYSGWLGLDYNYRSFLGGLAVSYDETITNYRTNDGNSGTITTRLGSIYPYARYAALGRKVQFWALAGLGGGTLELEENGSSMTTDVDTQLLAFGIKGDVLRLYGADLAIKSDASFSRFATESVTNLPSVTTEPQRLRAALEARYPIELDRVHQFTPSVELGGRLDLNNAVSGAGLEMSGGVLYSNRTLRLDVDLRARGLLAHRADAEEWGVSVLARLQPDQFGFGWFASVIPSWGRTQSGAARLWDEPIQEWQNSPIQDVSWQPDRLDAELGYAFGLRRTPAIVSPFTKIGTTRLGAQSLALGARFDLPAQPLRLELLGERLAAPSAAEAEHRIGLQLRMNF
ncbi:MAG: fibronectin type III domain-containing protein, partial [Hyphomicrobiales bacterium]|nr:fibronectin type III domain-containing protein [Hyphomicrobiales bacterium]